MEHVSGYFLGSKRIQESCGSRQGLAATYLGLYHIRYTMEVEPEKYKLFFADARDPKELDFVVILASEDVATLRSQIIQASHPLYENIAARKLQLYQVDIPSDQDRDQKVHEEMKALGRPLDPTYPIQEYYPSAPPLKTLHILVRSESHKSTG